MRKTWIIVAFASVLIIFGFSLPSIAGCKSECRETYETEVEACKETYDDPGDDDLLRTCIDDAENQFQSCMNECEN
jgi:hypothetical protein